MHICSVSLFITGFYIACLLTYLDTVYFPVIIVSVFLVHILYAFMLSYSTPVQNVCNNFYFTIFGMILLN